MKRSILLFILMCLTTHSQGFKHLDSDFNSKDFCSSPKIFSVKLFRSDSQICDPVITLNSGETVTLTFDEIFSEETEEGDYYYTLVHCDADWNEETLVTSEYMSGFSENDFETIKHSQKTMIQYRHFQIVLPNDRIGLKISGNYLVKVFDRNSAEHKPVLTKGFSVIEPIATIEASMIPVVLPPCRQQLEVKVHHNDLKITDVYVNLKLRIEQNSTRMPCAKEPLPAFVYPDYTDYTRMDRNHFPGRNEFRAFDIRSLLYNGKGIVGRYMEKNFFLVTVNGDIERSSYAAVNDINGKYMVASEYSIDPDIQSDYAEVAFSYVPNSVIEGRLFLFGELTNWSISDKYEMLYDDDNIYKCSTLLKQGYYNYQYVVLKPNGELDFSLTEGCFYETENNYNIYVYYFSPENRYDRLVGFQRISKK